MNGMVYHNKRRIFTTVDPTQTTTICIDAYVCDARYINTTEYINGIYALER